MKKKYPIVLLKLTLLKDKQNYMSLSQQIIKSYGLKVSQLISIRGGLKCHSVTLDEPVQDGYMGLSENILYKYGLRDGEVIGISYQRNMINIGPYIGVFVSKMAINLINKGKPHERVSELQKAARKEAVILYFFSVDDVDFINMEIYAFSFNFKMNIWEKVIYPYPDVIYDRGGGFTPEQMRKAKLIRKHIARLDAVAKYNSKHSFNKWDLHKRLSRHKEMLGYLPETVQYTGPDSLLAMMAKHNIIFLKGTNGSNGRQVIRVRKNNAEQIELNYFKSKNRTETVDSVNDLSRRIIQLYGLEEFIIQQGIDVIQYQGKNLDLRALVQRNGQGQWQVTAVVARVSVENCSITSTRTGSSCHLFDYAVNNILGFNNSVIKQLKKRITNLLHLAVNLIEKEYGNFGELGIDIALSKQKELFFIECNAKPGKDTIGLSGNKEGYMNSFLRPIQYCKLLAGYGESR